MTTERGVPVLEFNPNAIFSTQKLAGRTPLLVIDDCVADPTQLRSFGLGLRYARPTGDYYPGWKSAAALRGARAFYRRVSDAFLAALWPGGAPPQLAVTSQNVQTFAVLGFDPSQEPHFIDQHTDDEAWLATVLYLFPNEQARGRGTAFWRHRPTGLTHWLPTDIANVLSSEVFLGLDLTKPVAAAMANGIVPPIANLRAFGERLGGAPKPGRRAFSLEETDEWELVHFVEAKFNRMVIYPTFQIHSVVDTSDPTDASVGVRLTMNTFIDYPFPGPHIGRYREESYVPVEGITID
jgi:hypothetical protein